MILFKKSRLLNEIFFIGLLVYIFILVAQSLRLLNISILLPNKLTIFEILKNYFFAISFLMIIEYFIAYDLPNNYILSRVFGVLVMCTFTVIIFNFYSKSWIFVNKIAINLIYIGSIMIGMISSYFIQRLKLNRPLFIGIANYIIFASIFIIFSVISPIGYIFV